MTAIELNLEWLIRIIISASIGALIGYERHSQSKEAGIRTHIFVAMASTILMLISKYGFPDAKDFDAARIAAQVVSGIGFLGAGVIFVRKDSIQGLTTAAGIWTTSAIGLCVGAGLYSISAIATVIMIVVQIVFRSLKFQHVPRTSAYLLIRIEEGTSIKDLSDAFKSIGYNCIENRIVKDPEDPNKWIVLTEVTSQKDVEPATLLREMRKKPFIRSIEIN